MSKSTRQPECSGLTHPRGDVSPDVRYETKGATFHNRICPTCGRIQGVARIPRPAGASA